MKVQIRKSSGEIEEYASAERVIFSAENFELIIGGAHDRRVIHTIPTRLIAQADIRDDGPGSVLALKGGETIVKSAD